MNKAEIKRTIWNRIHSVAVTIDPVCVIGSAIIADENSPMTKSERMHAQNEYRKIRKQILKKSKKREEWWVKNIGWK